MIVKKSLVLIGVKKESEKAVLNIEKEGDLHKGRVRLYNFSTEPKGILSVGLFDGNNVVKAGLSKISNSLFEFKGDLSKFSDDFSCAIVNITNGEMTPILYGNTGNDEAVESKLSSIMSDEFSSPRTFSQTKSILDNNGVSYSADYENEINEEINKGMKDDCINCKYRKSFYCDNKTSVKNETEINFYDEIRPRIEKIFKDNQKEEYLERLIPNSKWVKVEYEEDGDYYILGLIYEDDELSFIVYGVPGVFTKNPPKEIAGKPVWFPLDENRKESFGYWLSYQDAKSGESVEAIVE